MIKSMTGYGRSQQLVDGMNITVEIKSVNHRYFEFSSKLSRTYGFLDEKLKSFFGQGRSGDVPIVDGDAHENVSHRTAHNVSRIACAVENFNRSIDL